MSPFLLGVVLILAGLVMAVLSGHAKFPLLAAVVFRIGILMAAVGAVLCLTPPLVWLNAQLREMLGLR